jgi:tRNA (cmo5U34)-methyltransferase
MTNVTGKWEFDKDVTKIFDGYVRKHVPMYDEMHRLISDLSVWLVEDYTTVYDIGTSTGEVIHNLLESNDGKQTQYVGLDISDDMVLKARNRFKDNPLVEIYQSSADEYIYKNASLITAILTLQFIPIRDRQGIVNSIYNGLNEGGGFIMVEKVNGNNILFNNMWNELYHDLKLRNGLTEKEVIEKSQQIRGVLKPLSLSENISMLENAGFKNVDIFFKWGNFVGLIAFK